MKSRIRLSVLLVLIILSGIALFGCGETKTIDGEWVLVKKILADGSVVKSKELAKSGMSEVYIISGEDVKYTCVTPGRKDVNIDMKMVKNEDGTYSFYAAETLLFAVADWDGKQLRYTLGEPEDTITFIFEKK